ncbi:ABC transporter permease subunit, partial [Bacillus sp. S34]|nr:ABC transporter permease subunit [Bacillus sp. S34]
MTIAAPSSTERSAGRCVGSGALPGTTRSAIATGVTLAASLSFFLSIGLGTGFLTVLLTHVAFDVAYVVVVLRARIAGTSRALEEAAGDLGATPFQAFRLVTLPLLAPGML